MRPLHDSSFGKQNKYSLIAVSDAVSEHVEIDDLLQLNAGGQTNETVCRFQ